MSTRILRLARGPDGRLLRRDERAALIRLLAETEKVTPMRLVDPAYTPKRAWTAGPGSEQTSFSLPGHVMFKFKPGHDGAYVFHSQEVEDFIRAALGHRFWLD